MEMSDLNNYLDQPDYSASTEELIYRAPAAIRYDFLIKRVCRTGRIWALWDGDGWLTTTGRDGRERFLVWPDAVFARRALDEELRRIEPHASVDSIELKKWVEHYLPDLQAHGDRVWAFPAAKLNGGVIGPEDMLKDIAAESEWLDARGKV